MTDKLLPNEQDVPLPLDEAVDAPEIVRADTVEEASATALEQERTRLGEENLAILKDIAQLGIAFDPPLLIIQLKMRVDMLTELLIPQDAPLRASFELAYEKRLNELLQGASRDAARAKLLAK